MYYTIRYDRHEMITTVLLLIIAKIEFGLRINENPIEPLQSCQDCYYYSGFPLSSKIK